MDTRAIRDIEQDLVGDFELFDEWPEKYQYIIDLGQKLKDFPEDQKTEENRVKGCQSSVWMVHSFDNGRISYQVDSDSVFVKGIASLLVTVLSGQKPEDIVGADLKFIERIGLSQHLAQTRANGLAAMVKQMKLYALAYQSKVN